MTLWACKQRPSRAKMGRNGSSMGRRSGSRTELLLTTSLSDARLRCALIPLICIMHSPSGRMASPSFLSSEVRELRHGPSRPATRPPPALLSLLSTMYEFQLVIHLVRKAEASSSFLGEGFRYLFGGNLRQSLVTQ